MLFRSGMKVAISKHLEKENEELALSTNLQEAIAALNDFSKLQQSGNISYITLPVSNERLLPYVLQTPILDLNPLPPGSCAWMMPCGRIGLHIRHPLVCHLIGWCLGNHATFQLS